MLSRLRAVFECLIFAGVFLGSLVTLSGLLGAFVPLFDSVNHFQLVFFSCGFIAFLLTFVWPYYYTSFKRPAQIFLLAAMIVSGGLISADSLPRIFASRLSDRALSDRGLKPLTYMSFNIYLGTWDGLGLAKTIRRHNPEIVTLQEYAPRRFRRQPDLKRDYPYQARCGNWRRCTLAILSKHPMDDIKRYDLGPPVARNPMHGKMLAATIRVKGSPPIRVYNVHLSWPLPVDQQQRQMAEIAQIIQQEHGRHPHQIVSGDFNSTGWAFAVDRLAKKAGLNRTSHFVPTFPSPNSRIKGVLRLPSFLSLDHIMVSEDLQTGPVVRVATPIGDHWPILTELYLPKS